MHYVDANKMHKEKVSWELHKNAACCLEQILETALHKTAAVLPSASHLINHSSKTDKTCGALLKKLGQTHKRYFLVDTCTWICQYWLTSKIQPRIPARNDG